MIKWHLNMFDARITCVPSSFARGWSTCFSSGRQKKRKKIFSWLEKHHSQSWLGQSCYNSFGLSMRANCSALASTRIRSWRLVGQPRSFRRIHHVRIVVQTLRHFVAYDVNQTFKHGLYKQQQINRMTSANNVFLFFSMLWISKGFFLLLHYY